MYPRQVRPVGWIRVETRLSFEHACKDVFVRPLSTLGMAIRKGWVAVEDNALANLSTWLVWLGPVSSNRHRSSLGSRPQTQMPSAPANCRPRFRLLYEQVPIPVVPARSQREQFGPPSLIFCSRPISRAKRSRCNAVLHGIYCGVVKDSCKTKGHEQFGRVRAFSKKSGLGVKTDRFNFGLSQTL